MFLFWPLGLMPRKRAKWPMELILGEEESEFHKQDQGIQDQDRDLLTEETGTGDTEVGDFFGHI